MNQIQTIKTNTALLQLRDERSQLLENDVVKSKLTSIEYQSAKKSLGLMIRDYTEEERVQKCSIFFTMISKDVGIHNIDDDQVIRLSVFLMQYFSHWTFEEIRLAFEYLVLGKLDEFLPKTSKGDPDKGHFQLFSTEYLSKILKAYRSFKDRVWLKVMDMQPRTQMQELEIKKTRIQTINKLIDAFTKYSEEQVRVQLNGVTAYLNLLKGMGLASGVPKVEDRHIELAKADIMSNQAGRGLKRLLESEYVTAKAQHYANRDSIFEFFEVCVLEDYDIIERLENEKNKIQAIIDGMD